MRASATSRPLSWRECRAPDPGKVKRNRSQSSRRPRACPKPFAWLRFRARYWTIVWQQSIQVERHHGQPKSQTHRGSGCSRLFETTKNLEHHPHSRNFLLHLGKWNCLRPTFFSSFFLGSTKPYGLSVFRKCIRDSPRFACCWNPTLGSACTHPAAVHRRIVGCPWCVPQPVMSGKARFLQFQTRTETS